ncbi:MAG: choice-of-anchor H family protein [Gammaproteobacteria bacterium]|nr:choice-of-anchor H family protein [Gammaproteobacteria bacterium]NNF49349.1 hypothetical protein [Woeseiaceae bacterium]MBT8093578.1 choice-of-anchor H family protein [Gammaproteobacteria bacterium]MBT8106458.1 choice-of-anchor H family protein [Gammaproteobacteria bacterium]NNK26473.1 hypothetical protein [Woeseiaceae bacterium]
MRHFIRTVTLILLSLLGAVGMADTGEEPRQSFTSQGQGIERGSVGDGIISFDEHAPLRLKHAGQPGEPNKSLASGARTAEMGVSADSNFWFYDVDVILFADHDRDGYYYGIDLLFDADTTYFSAEVYAVIYLSYEFGPWNEYAATEDFTLLGATSEDEYTIETELVSGYPAGSYDILIELFDAYDGTFLVSIGPEDTSELSYLSLEDSTRDATQGGTTQVVVSSGGGGSLGWLVLLTLLAVRMTLRPQPARLSK